MAKSWYPLTLGTATAGAQLPPLLISTAFEADSYTVHLTDLTYIWVESLDHAGILERAEDENTSIDPTDNSQLQILLSKLRLALSHGPKTTLNLRIDKTSGREPRPGITLNLTIELPDGLAPLEWPIHLAAAPQTVLTDQLTIPLLRAQHERTQEAEGLKEALNDKDHVIQKLMDKIEALGVDFGQVFPQATVKSGRKVDRTRAEEKVRGLRPFDSNQDEDTAQFGQKLLGDHLNLDLKIESTEKNNWWGVFKGTAIAISGAGTTREQVLRAPALKPKESTEDNDAFQVQSSPPHRASRAPKDSQNVTLGDTTDDEDLPSQPSIVPDSFPTSQSLARGSQVKQAKKLGSIGGKKETSKKPSPSPAADDTTDDEESQPKPTRKGGDIGRKRKLERTKSPSPPPANEKTTDNAEAPAPPREPSLTPSPSPPPPPASTSKPKKGTLGRIGGKKEPLPPPPSSSSPSPSPPASVAASKPRKSKLGQIGGKKKEATPPPTASKPSSQEATSSQTPVKRKLGLIGGRNKAAQEENNAVEVREEETRGRSTKLEKEKTPPPRETSEERAEKKRRELKRELEQKAKAPAKKKRKF